MLLPRRRKYMETLLRKYLWTIDLAVLVVSAVFAARATGVMIETALGRATPTVPALHRPSTASAPTTYYNKDVEAILKRNIFCSTCPPIPPCASPGRWGGISTAVGCPARVVTTRTDRDD